MRHYRRLKFPDMKNETPARTIRLLLNICCIGLVSLPCVVAQIETSSYTSASVYAATADSLVKAGKSEEALTFLLQSKAALEMRGDRKSGDYLNILRTLGFIYYNNRMGVDEARRYLEAAANLLQQIEPGNKADLAFLWHIIGKTYYYYYPGKAAAYFEKSLPLWLGAFGENDGNTSRCYNALALCYKETGNYEKSVNYSLKAIRSLKKGHPDLGAYLCNLGYIYLSTGDLDEALKYLDQSLQTIETGSGSDEDLALCLSMLGSTHAAKGNGDKAVEYEARALEIFKKTGDEGDIKSCYSDLGHAYYVKREYLQSIEYYQKSLSYGVPEGEPLPQQPDVLLGMAYDYHQLGNYNEALSRLDSALSALRYARPVHPDSLANRILAYRSLLLKATILADKYDAGDKEVAYLQHAGELLSDALSIILSRIGAFYQDKNKLAFYRLAVEGNARAIEVYTRLYSATHNPDWLRQTFEFAEINKSLLLYQMVLENKARMKFTVPDSLSAYEEMLRQNIAETEIALSGLSSKPLPVASSDSIQDRLFTLKNRYDLLRRDIEAVCPDYFAAASAFPHENIRTIQSGLLDDSTGLVEYFTSDSMLCTFLLRRDTFFFHQTRIDSLLKKQVREMRWGLYGYFTARERTPALYLQTMQAYVENASALYQLLIAPLANYFPPKLVIIPDGVLGYLPFEALLSGHSERPDRFQRLPYLLRKYDISYCFSAALLREMKAMTPGRANDNLLAVAPFYEGPDIGNNLPADRTSMHPLPYSGDEVRQIATIMNGRAVVGRQATKTGFIRLAPGFRILHLATHGRANDRAGDFSFLAFPSSADSLEAEQLTAREIYTLKLNADLVTLSACETGLGQLYRGEGFISLSRAFASAGTKSIVHSLWTVNDAGTKNLMAYFYGNLRRGMAKDAALRQAKLSYLSKFRGEEAHPFFWSGFVLVGDSGPLLF